MSHIFISYSRRDTETVDQIAGSLNDSGLDVWLDRHDIKAGNQWRVQIVEAIDTCEAFVLMLSPHSAASDNVRKEIDLAQDAGRTIFAILLEPVKLPATIRYQLAGLQFIDVSMLGFEPAVSQLVETLNEHVAALRAVAEPQSRQAELVIQGVNLKDFSAEKQQQLLDFVAQLTNVGQSELKIANLAAGSVHVFVDMPPRAAYELKTLALNQDPRLKRFGIVALRLDGNQKYVNTANGMLMANAAVGPLTLLWLKLPALFSSAVGVTGGKLLALLVAGLVIAGVGLTIPKRTDLPVLPNPTPTSTLPVVDESTSTSMPVDTATNTATVNLTATATATATQTPTSTITPIPTYQFLEGTVTADRLTCRFGPGEPYLAVPSGLIRGNTFEFFGRMDVQSGDETSLWLYGLPQGYRISCWVNADFIRLNGDPSDLEPDYYPDKAKLPPFFHEAFPLPGEVRAVRAGDQVTITWTTITLELGDRESARSPMSLLETWTCQDGEIVFTPFGAYGPLGSAQITDEPGCSEISRGRVYLSHKEGYVGPVPVAWPPYPTATP